MKESKKFYVATVEEVLRRRVIVKCDPDYDTADAEELIDELCGSGRINLDCDDFQERNVTVLHEASAEELEELPVYLA